MVNGSSSRTVLDSAWLRGLPSLTGAPPIFDIDDVPDDPLTLFAHWFAEAVRDDVPEPRAMTLSTLGQDGMPDARVLILKGVSVDGWAFAGPRSSAKAAQLATHPAAALSFWWQPQMRALRLRGQVHEASAADSAADLAQRPAAARDDIDPDDWVLWRLMPEQIEFWQGATDRRHLRLIYRRQGGAWVHARHGAVEEDRA